jgi:hypothetical protein
MQSKLPRIIQLYSDESRAVDIPFECIIIPLMNTVPTNLTIRKYPQLALIAWSRPADDEITAEEAFWLYESNWRFVDQNGLGPEERDLIQALVKIYGNGLMNV